MSSGRSRSGGHADRHDVEPVEEILAEAAGLHLGGEIAVGRGDEAHVDGLGAPADLLHLARLQRAQDLGLDGAAASSPISSMKSVPLSACWK